MLALSTSPDQGEQEQRNGRGRDYSRYVPFHPHVIVRHHNPTEERFVVENCVLLTIGGCALPDSRGHQPVNPRSNRKQTQAFLRLDLLFLAPSLSAPLVSGPLVVPSAAFFFDFLR